MPLKPSAFAIIIVLLTCLALPARSEVFLRELPDAYVVRATGLGGYTAVIDRADGHLRSLSCGRGEIFEDPALPVVLPKDAQPWLGFATEQVGFMGVLAEGKPVVARGIPAKSIQQTWSLSEDVAAPQPGEDNEAVFYVTSANDGPIVIYRFGRRGFGICLARGQASLVMRWGKESTFYSTGENEFVFGHAAEKEVEAMPVDVRSSGGKAAVGVLPATPGKMTLAGHAIFPLSEQALWIVSRPTSPEDDLPLLRLLTFRVHDSDEGYSWTPHPQDYALLDKLLLKPGEPLVARFQQFGPRALATRYKAPRAGVFALDIADGDPQLLREGRHGWPGMYPALVPVNWQSLPTTLADGVASADTNGLKPGTYRIRVAIGDGNVPDFSNQARTPEQNAGTFSDDAFIVVSAPPAAGKPGPARSLDLFTEQNRDVYFIGESIPATVLVRSSDLVEAGKATTSVSRGSQPIGKPAGLMIPEIEASSVRVPFSVDAADLAPGVYRVDIEYAGLTAAREFEIVDPVGPSPIAISESQIPGSPFANTLMGSPFGGKPVDSLAHGLAAPYADLQVTSFRNELAQGYQRKFNQRLADTLDAIHAGPAAERIGVYDLRHLWMDGMTRLRMGYWQGVQTRGLSFSKANTLPGTEDEIRRRLVEVSHDYGAYANFLGPQVDVDCGAVAADGQLAWMGVPDPLTKAFRERVRDAQEKAFRSDFAAEIAAAGDDQAAIDRLRSEWYRGVWAKCDAKDKAALRLLDPTLKITANREYHHGTVAGGQYAPSLYAGLDITHVEAWGDALDNALFADAWASMGVAGRRALNLENWPFGRTDMPIWIETQAYHADMPGYLQTHWWGALANGADGVGYAANVFGLRQYSGIEPHQPTFKRQTAAAMAEMVRKLGPTFRELYRLKRVAVLFSKTEADYNRGHDYGLHCFGAQPPYVSFFALAMAGYQPEFVLEEQIANGAFVRHYSVLYLTWQQHALPPAVQAKIAEFVAKGGKIVLDAACDPELFPKAIRVDVNPREYKGPHAFGGPEDWAWIDAAVPKLRAALDPITRLPGRVEHPRCLAYWFAGWGAAEYAIVINEGYEPVQATLVCETSRIGYDLLTGRQFGPTDRVPVDLRNVNARIYAFMPGPVTGIAVRATPKLTAGDPFAIEAVPAGGNGPSDGVAPATLEVRAPDGRVRWERWTMIGKGIPAVGFETTATEPPGTYTATVKELLSGKTASFPIVIEEGKIRSVLNTDGKSDVAISEVDRRALATLWNMKGAAWSIVVDAAQPQRTELAGKLARLLGKRGMNVDVWSAPEIVRMPVGYQFTPEQEAIRERVFSGQAIGDRYYLHGWDGDKQAPYGETWEPREGIAIYRNVIFLGTPGESRLLDRFGPDPGPHGAIKAGIRQFAGDFDAIFLAASNDEALDGVLKYALSLEPKRNDLVGPERGRSALKAGLATFRHTYKDQLALSGGGMLIPRYPSVPLKPVDAEPGEPSIAWSQRIGRPVMAIQYSPNRRHVLVKHHGKLVVNGQLTPDGKLERVFFRPIIGDMASDDVLGVDDSGSLILAGKDGSRRLWPIGGEPGPEQPAPPVWQSADGKQSIVYVPYTVEEKDKDGKPVQAKKQKLVRRDGDRAVFESETIGNAPGGVIISSNGRYAWQPSDGSPRSQHIGPRIVTMHSAETGETLWTKKGWWVFASAWSRDGETFAVVRHYPNVDRHGVWPEQFCRCTLSLVRASDGEVMAEGHPTTWVDRIAIATDGSFAVGFPAYMADHYWLLGPGQEPLVKVKASSAWLYNAVFDASSGSVVTLDMNGVLRRHRPDGEVIWESKAFVAPYGAILGMLVPFGDDLFLGSTAGRVYRVNGKDGSIAWQACPPEEL